MRDFRESFAGVPDLLPHGRPAWNPEGARLHVGSDLLPGLTY